MKLFYLRLIILSLFASIPVLAAVNILPGQVLDVGRLDLSGTYYSLQELNHSDELRKKFNKLEDEVFRSELIKDIEDGISIWFLDSIESGALGFALPKSSQAAKLLNPENQTNHLVLTPKTSLCVYKHEKKHIHQQNEYGHFSRVNPIYSENFNAIEDKYKIRINNYFNEVLPYEKGIHCMEENNLDSSNELLKFDYFYLSPLQRAMKTFETEKIKELCSLVQEFNTDKRLSPCNEI